MSLIVKRRLGRVAVGGVLAGTLLACSQTYRPGGEARPHLFAGWESVPPERADVRFEAADAPDVIAARRRIGHDGVRLYEVSLANRTLDFGENKVIVATREQRDQRPLAVESDLATFEFTPAVVERNADLLLKGARRTSPPTTRRNRYGPYHFIAAEYPGSSRCVYAWQEVEGGFLAAGGDGDAALQFRFCDPERPPA